MALPLAAAGCLLVGAGGSLGAQVQPAAAPASTSALLQPGVSELQAAISGLRTAKWKAPGPIREEADGNVASITRDLQATLPALVADADATPASVASAFAVYRNLDALYEVVLRVSGTADLAAPGGEATSLEHALATLDGERRALADEILTASRAQESAIARQREARAAAAAAAPPSAPAPPNVVADGPASQSTRKKAKLKAKPGAPGSQP